MENSTLPTVYGFSILNNNDKIIYKKKDLSTGLIEKAKCAIDLACKLEFPSFNSHKLGEFMAILETPFENYFLIVYYDISDALFHSRGYHYIFGEGFHKVDKNSQRIVPSILFNSLRDILLDLKQKHEQKLEITRKLEFACENPLSIDNARYMLSNGTSDNFVFMKLDSDSNIYCISDCISYSYFTKVKNNYYTIDGNHQIDKQYPTLWYIVYAFGKSPKKLCSYIDKGMQNPAASDLEMQDPAASDLGMQDLAK
jgi:hypothetical protein